MLPRTANNCVEEKVRRDGKEVHGVLPTVESMESGCQLLRIGQISSTCNMLSVFLVLPGVCLVKMGSVGFVLYNHRCHIRIGFLSAGLILFWKCDNVRVSNSFDCDEFLL
jgi:hypothetical protein